MIELLLYSASQEIISVLNLLLNFQSITRGVSEQQQDIVDKEKCKLIKNSWTWYYLVLC